MYICKIETMDTMANKDINTLIQKLSSSLVQKYDDESFYNYIKNAFDKYISELTEYGHDVEILLNQTNELVGKATYRRFSNLMKKINSCCLDILECAYSGDILSATIKLSNLLSVCKYTDYKLMDVYANYLQNERVFDKELFRCVDFDRGEKPDNCNHVPFDLRQKASKGRFNQLGFPCLYLSNSLECAQKEIGETVKEGKSRWYGVFVPQRTLCFADFSIPSNDDILTMTDYDKFAFLITYPLRLLCLTPAKHEDAAFIEEYTFSQLFLHILFLNNNVLPHFDGICYTSLKDLRSLNFVIPAKYKSQTPPTSGISDNIKAMITEIKVERI